MEEPVRRIEPAFPDLFSVSHVLRPGYLPASSVTLDPIRMGIVWQDAPHRILPADGTVPRMPVRAIAFGRVATMRGDIVERVLERGSSLLLVLDDPKIKPDDVGLDGDLGESQVTALLPVLPSPLADKVQIPTAWKKRRWGAVLGLFPFPGAMAEIEQRVTQLWKAGASFAIAAPLLLTPKDRHRILDGCEGCGHEAELENALFHADVSRGLHALERKAGVAVDTMGMEPVVPYLIPGHAHPKAVHTAALLRLWARRLDQSHEESSWGWRLRRAAAALEPLDKDPESMAVEGNLRIIPGFDSWVESFTRALWDGGNPVAAAWRRWTSPTNHK